MSVYKRSPKNFAFLSVSKQVLSYSFQSIRKWVFGRVVDEMDYSLFFCTMGACRRIVKVPPIHKCIAFIDAPIYGTLICDMFKCRKTAIKHVGAVTVLL